MSATSSLCAVSSTDTTCPAFFIANYSIWKDHYLEAKMCFWFACLGEISIWDYPYYKMSPLASGQKTVLMMAMATDPKKASATPTNGDDASDSEAAPGEDSLTVTVMKAASRTGGKGK